MRLGSPLHQLLTLSHAPTAGLLLESVLERPIFLVYTVPLGNDPFPDFKHMDCVYTGVMVDVRRFLIYIVGCGLSFLLPLE